MAPHRRDELGMQHLTLGLAAEEGKGFDKGFGLDSWDAKKYYPGLLHRIQGGGVGVLFCSCMTCAYSLLCHTAEVILYLV